MNQERYPVLFSLGLALIITCVPILVSCAPNPEEPPAIEALTGTYRLSEKSYRFLKRTKKYKEIPESTITLMDNGEIMIRDIPDCAFSGFGDSYGGFLSDNGVWEVESMGEKEYGITFTIPREAYQSPIHNKSEKELPRGRVGSGIHYASMLIKNKYPPYDLEITIGDPDLRGVIRYELEPRPD